ncbi:MAG: endonuclease III, partial [Candidatus Heimdallarchaeota archaeon]|nr:endonuclease III [Candidatus Heimdallarchaeota archaeon]
QSTDKRVNLITPELFKAFPSATRMSAASIDEIKEYIKSVGLYNNKAKSLFGMAQMVDKSFGGTIPDTMHQLITLPGVGRKTANVVLGNAFKIPDSGITVDTHVTRLSARIGWSNAKTTSKIEQDLMKIIPVKEWVNITHLLIDHGRSICGRKPKCDECVINTECLSSFDFKHFKKI